MEKKKRKKLSSILCLTIIPIPYIIFYVYIYAHHSTLLTTRKIANPNTISTSFQKKKIEKTRYHLLAQRRWFASFSRVSLSLVNENWWRRNVPPVVTLTSRRQISALPAIKVPPYRAIGRNNGVINLESFRGGPNSTSVPRNGGREEERLASSDPSSRWEHNIARTSPLSNNQSIPGAVGDYVCS